MITSRDRILTTHVGSLPRNEALSELLIKREVGEPFDQRQFDAEMDRAVRHVVEKQKAAGIDIGNDGEQQRVGFQTYVPQRMTGFGGVSKRRRGREFEEFPDLMKYLMRRFPVQTKGQHAAPEAQADLKYTDTGPIQREVQRFQAIAR
jgi:5-methyltetrahydropteroyltriglutamate--homocysteine methyltransferase